MSLENSEKMTDFDCPCGSGNLYKACCQPIHQGKAALTAEQLMRSRFSAFVLGLTDYLLQSWHPATRPPQLTLDQNMQWQKLIINGCKKGRAKDKEGWVTFSAFYQLKPALPFIIDKESHNTASSQQSMLQEKSYFLKEEDGRWYYVDGDIKTQ